MGLDITAHEKIIPIGRHTADGEWCEEENHQTVFVYKGFQQSGRGLNLDVESRQFMEGGCVETSGEMIRFRAGSYSGYGLWRKTLSEAALGVPPETVWADPDAWRDQPFFELIHFADNEGTIGFVAADDLARDFAEHRDTVRPKLVAVYDRYGEKYDEWQAAFELAAGGGMVRFH